MCVVRGFLLVPLFMCPHTPRWRNPPRVATSEGPAAATHKRTYFPDSAWILGSFTPFPFSVLPWRPCLLIVSTTFASIAFRPK